jgi:hypothetical protein
LAKFWILALQSFDLCHHSTIYVFQLHRDFVKDL